MGAVGFNLLVSYLLSRLDLGLQNRATLANLRRNVDKNYTRKGF